MLLVDLSETALVAALEVDVLEVEGVDVAGEIAAVVLSALQSVEWGGKGKALGAGAQGRAWSKDLWKVGCG